MWDFHSPLARAVEICRSRRTRNIVAGIIIAVAFYGAAMFFAVPLLVTDVVVPRLAASLHRPVSVRRVAFNPYDLVMKIEKLHVGTRSAAAGASLADIDFLRVEASWESVIYLVPVIEDVTINRPVFHLARVAPNRFNVSDLLESSQPVPKAPSKPWRFSIYNIRLHDGEIHFDDEVLKQQHLIENIQIGIPFIANVRSAINVYVQPLLQMVVDGSPLRIAGKAKPFADPPESLINVNLHRLSLPRFAAYVPKTIAVKIPSGTLSSALQIDFVSAPGHPFIRVSGTASLDSLDLRDASDAPLAELGHASVALRDVEPLEDIAHLQRIHIDGLKVHAVRNRSGAINFVSAMHAKPASGPRGTNPAVAVNTQPASAAKAPSASAATPAPSGSPNAQQSPAASAAATPGQPAASPTAEPTSSVAATPAPSAAPTPTQSPVGTPNSPAATATATAAASASATPTPPAASPKPQATSSTKPTSGVPTASRSPKPLTAGITQGVTSNPVPTPSVLPSSRVPVKGQTKFDLTLASFELTNSSIQITDQTLPIPATLAINGIHFALQNLATSGQAPAAPFTLAATLGGGGTIAAKGDVKPARQRMKADITFDQIDLPALQPFAKPTLMAIVASGKLSAHAKVIMQAGGTLIMQAGPADASIDNFELRAPNQSQNPVGWSKLSVVLTQADLIKHQAALKQVRLDGLNLIVQRERNGQLSLASLISRPAPSPAPAAPPSAAPSSTTTNTRRSHKRGRAGASSSRVRNSSPRAPPQSAPAGSWSYQIESVDLENARIQATDESGPAPTTLALAPFNAHLKNISSDFAKPITIELDGALNRTGDFKVAGNAALSPLQAHLKIQARRIDLAMANPYLSSGLNATIKSAQLSLKGTLDTAQAQKNLRLRYRGDALVSGVKMVDKVTNQTFVDWNLFHARRIDFALGQGPPRVHVGALGLSDFYARVILNRDAHLNLSDIMAGPHAPPTSLTRPAPVAQPPPAAPSGAPIRADIELGGVTFERGRVNYTDHFIQPNYSADLTDLHGKIGAFGSRSTTPADIAINAQVNRSAPVVIRGSMDPLAPMASADITAKANGVELPGLTPYSTKYTGYPITSGTLTMDVHYVLKNQNLTAENHILLDQLTFGDKVEQKSVLNLPIRLAVALLKGPTGQIKLDIPISGSLSNPHFSVGAVIVHVLTNLVLKAATSPFSLLAAAVGGGGSNQDYNHVDFTPGWAILTKADIQKLGTLAQALSKRPAVKVSITGRVDPKLDVPGLRDAMLQTAVGEQKIKDLGAKAAGDNPATIKIAPDEYGKYLWSAYKAAKFTKPTNLVGMTKRVPQAEMKKLMLEHYNVTEKDLRNLANARAEAVRKELATHVGASRLSIAAPKLTAEGIKEGKTTRADLSLE